MMPTATLTEHRPLLGHHPIGASTGYLVEADAATGPRLVERPPRCRRSPPSWPRCRRPSCRAWSSYLAGEASLPFHYVSVHAPSKGRGWPRPSSSALLARPARDVDAIVVHPDVIEDPASTAASAAGSCSRTWTRASPTAATRGRAGAATSPCCPRPGCASTSPTPATSTRDARGARAARPLRRPPAPPAHLLARRRRPPRAAATSDEEAFAPLLRRCRDVPWILEAPLTP